MRLFTALILAATTLFIISLQRTFASLPAKELKRRARGGDELSGKLYKAAVYGQSLRAILWLKAGILASIFFVFVTVSWPIWPALLASGLLVWASFVWLPAGETSNMGRRVAGFLAPALARLLYYTHPAIERTMRTVRRMRRLHTHTGLYEKADLLDLIDQQQNQHDNRIEHFELEIARSALVFGDKLISDVMTPRRAVKMVAADDDLGPIIMDELHASDHSRFPVYDGKKDNITGTLFLRDVLKKQGKGKVSSVMQKQVLYLHEDQTLYDALQAVLKTHHHLFVVVNSQEEYAGIITIKDILEQIVGEQIVDEFEQYDDKRAVAAVSTARKQPPAEDEEITTPKPEPEVDATVDVE